METNPFPVNLCSAQNTTRCRKSINPTIPTVVYTETLRRWLNKTGNVRVNVTMRRVRATIVAVRKQQYYMFWVRVCSPSCPACNAHDPHFTVICEPVLFYYYYTHIYTYIHIIYIYTNDRLCGLVVRVSGYRYRGPGFDPRRYQIFWVLVRLERGPLSLVRSNCGATWIKK